MINVLRKISRIFCRGKVTDVDGSRPMRVLQISGFADDVRDDVEHAEPYGFTSEPHIGDEAFFASGSGDRDNSVALCVFSRKYRPKGLRRGEVCVFDDLGRKVFFMREKIVIEGVDSPIDVVTKGRICLKGAKIVLDAPVEATSTVTAKSDITDLAGSGGSSMSAMRSVFNGHVHRHGDTSSNPPTEKM